MADVVGLRHRVARDTDPSAPTEVTEAAVLRAMARNERHLEHVVEGLKELGAAVRHQGRVFVAGATVAIVAILVVGVALVVAAVLR